MEDKKVAPSSNCHYCGAPVTWTGDFCPYCGTKKKQFEEHRSEMKAYQADFQKTKEGVVEENRRFSKTAGKITLISILAVLVLATVIAVLNVSRIVGTEERKKVIRNAPTHRVKLEEFLSEEDYLGFQYYWSSQNLFRAGYDGPLSDFRMMQAFTSNYSDMVNALMRFARLVNVPEKDEYTETSLDRCISSIASCYYEFARKYTTVITEFDPDTRYTTYDRESYTEENFAYIDDMYHKMDCMLSYYLNIPMEEVEGMHTMNEARIGGIIAEAVEQMEKGE